MSDELSYIKIVIEIWDVYVKEIGKWKVNIFKGFYYDRYIIV